MSERPTFDPEESKDKQKSEKEIIWEEKLKKVDKIKDSLENEVDELVKETVAAFHVNGLSTSGSCEGHIDWGCSAPWIQVEAVEKPDERFVGQDEIEIEVAEKYGLRYEDLRYGISEESPDYKKRKKAWYEAHKRMIKNGETEAYKEWVAKNNELREKAGRLLEEFYQGREVSDDVKLVIEERAEETFRVRNGGENYLINTKKRTKEQIAEITDNLPKCQQEMKEFTEFLKRKYFESM